MRTFKILTVSAAIIAASAFAVNNVVNSEESSNSSENGYHIGDTAANFKLKNIDGKMVSLSDFDEAKGFIVVFTTNHCPYAKAYENRIVALDKKYKPKGYPVIAINPNDPNKNEQDSFENMQLRAKQKGFTFPYLLDEGQKIYPVYGATKTPHVYLLQKERKGNIVKYIGAIDDNYQDPNDVKETFLENAIQELLAGKEVSVKTTKAIGCSIK
ncbi:thioredoxin family protein [Mesonia aestuariivivens]|uniref:Thioredoxin family protein n=1 Tax=Mesonia aestuariivivens TaxID=2796128 RepID=A0ABS6W003_9FLAO|nr:thioredoxin family protein [Mesonia aestuariivivens]MBW2960887.1 thioredoxin family protein [Mesonia aestuariivivens]